MHMLDVSLSTRGYLKAKVAIISKESATFELNGFLLNLPERTTVPQLSYVPDH